MNKHITKEDLIQGKTHADAVCRVTFGVDVHSLTKKESTNVKNYNIELTIKFIKLG